MALRTFSVGATGRDYSTIASFLSALAAGTLASVVAADDVLAELYDDAAFTPSAILTIGTDPVGITSLTIRPAAGHYHDGTPGTGVRIVSPAVAHTIDVVDPAFKLQIEGLEISAVGQTVVNRLIRAGTASRDVDTVINRCLLHDVAPTGNATDRAAIFSGVRRSYRVSNNIIWNISSNSTNGGHHLGGILLDSTSGLGVERYVRNNTVHNVQRGGTRTTGVAAGIYVVDLSTMNLRNNLVTGVGGSGTVNGCIHPATFVNATVGYNATSDTSASGTGSITNVVAANIYTDIALGNFLLKAGAVVLDAGLDVGTTGVGHIDILGRDRDAKNDIWDIGAHEYLGPPVNVTYTVGQGAGQDYSTVQLAVANFGNTTIHPDGSTITLVLDSGSSYSATTASPIDIDLTSLHDNLSQVTIRPTAGDAHNGVIGAGVVIGTSGSSPVYLSGNVLIEDIEFNGGGAESFGPLAVHNGATARRLIVHNVTSTGDGVSGISASVGANLVESCIVRNINGNTSNLQAGIYSAGGTIVRNCTVDGISGGTSFAGFRAASDAAAVWQNNVATNCSGPCFAANVTPATSTNNASSDGTADDFGGTGHIVSLIRADAFAAPDTGDYKPKAGSALIDAGVDLGTSTDIAGVSRDTAGSGWDIGAFEYVASAGGTTGTVGAEAPVATASASGTPAVIGIGTVEAPASTVNAAGTSEVTGAAAGIAPASEVAASGTPSIVGSGDAFAPAAEADISGTSTVVGEVDVAAPASTSDASGTSSIQGTVDAESPAATVAATGAPGVTGTADVSAPAAEVNASDDGSISGSANITASPAEVSASGTPVVDGAVAADAPASTASASGTSAVIGTVDAGAPASEVSVSGAPVVAGSVDGHAPAAGVDASGSPVVAGTADAAAPAPTVDANDYVDPTGTVAAVAPPSEVAAAGTSAITGQGGAVAPPADVDASGSPVIAGVGSVEAPPATASVAGAPTVAGVAYVEVPAAEADVVGTPVITGTVDAAAPAAVVVVLEIPPPVYYGVYMAEETLTFSVFESGTLSASCMKNESLVVSRATVEVMPPIAV